MFAGREEESTLCRSRSNSPYATSASMLLLHTQVGNIQLLYSIRYLLHIRRCEGVKETGRSSDLCVFRLSTPGSYIKIDNLKVRFRLNTAHIIIHKLALFETSNFQ